MLYAFRTLALAAAVLLTGGAAMAQDVLHARVSHDAGSLLVQGRGEGNWANAPINTIVLPGDTVWVDQHGTAEVEFPGGAYLRLADGSKAEVTALSPTASVRAWIGSFYVHRLSRASGDFVVTTPSATVEVDPNSSVRVDIDSAGAAVVTVRFGYAKVRATQGSPVGAGAGTRVFVDPGLLPSEAISFALSEEDAFDQWNRERVKLIVTGPTPTPSAVKVSLSTLGVHDLGHYGEWVYVDNRHYWRPTVVVDYVPYRHGYWSYVPAYGHVWVGNYGFSYVTSHYGRWSYINSYGWCWAYDPVWSPAWVAGVRVGPYHVWTPVDFYNRPVYWGDTVYFSVGGLRFSYAACSYAPYDYLYHGPGHVSGLYGTNFTSIYADEVNIWNIYNKPNPRYRVPYRSDGDLITRDYTPNRSIRGPEVYGGRDARDRVRTLEASAGRDRFDTVDPGDRRTVRTGTGDRSRQASVRTVSRIDHTDRDALIRQSNERAATVRSARSDVDSNIPTTTRQRGTTTTRESGVSTTGTRTPSTTRGSDTGSVRSTPTTRTAPATGVRTAPEARSGSSSVRTPATTSRGSSLTTAPRTTGNRPATSVRTPSTTSRTSPGITTTPSTRSTPSTSSRTSVPSTRSAPSTSTRTSPSTRSGPQVIRTQPSTSSRVTVTGPSSSSRVSTPSPTSVTRPAPTRSTSPSRSYTSPSPSSRSISTPSPSPSRSSSPSTRSYSRPSPSPSRSISTPSPSPSRSSSPSTRSYSRPAPSPSRSISTPSPSPSRSFSAPSRSSSPSPRSISSPSPSPSRSFSAPSRSSSPSPRSISSPSPSPSRSFSAPSSRSGGSSRGISVGGSSRGSSRGGR